MQFTLAQSEDATLRHDDAALSYCCHTMRWRLMLLQRCL